LLGVGFLGVGFFFGVSFLAVFSVSALAVFSFLGGRATEVKAEFYRVKGCTYWACVLHLLACSTDCLLLQEVQLNNYKKLANRVVQGWFVTVGAIRDGLLHLEREEIALETRSLN